MTEHDPTFDDDYDDDQELELEAIDPEILENERQRTLRQTRKAEDSIDINELYREAEPSDPFEISSLKQFRFSIRHLLIATALLSIAMTIIKYTDTCTGPAILFALTVASGWWFVIREERRQQRELQRARQENRDRIAAQRAAEDGISETSLSASEKVSFDPPPESPQLQFSFSLKEMLGAFTAAAVILGLVQSLGGPDKAAVLLGSIALLGLVMHAIGFDPPQAIILGWWLLLVLYIVVSIIAAFSPEVASLPSMLGQKYLYVS